METPHTNTPWRETTLFQNLKEITHEGYRQMLEYETQGGVLDMMDLSARKHYERYYRNRKTMVDIQAEESGEE